jgi:putative Mg2+ transporter-C (MgtC) family protein
MGLAIGIGFYSAAIIAGVCIFLSLTLFSKIEESVFSKSKIMNIYIELESIARIKEVVNAVKEKGIKVYDMHFSQDNTISGNIGIHITLKLPHRGGHGEIEDWLMDMEGVTLLEEL